MSVSFADGTSTLADFSRLRIAHPYQQFMPQWHLLDMLARAGERAAAFTLLRSTEVTDVITSDGVVQAFAPGDRAGRSRSGPTWSSPPTAEDRRHVSAWTYPSGRSLRRWTCCGSGCRVGPPTPTGCRCAPVLAA